jgi:hypothetical protein
MSHTQPPASMSSRRQSTATSGRKSSKTTVAAAAATQHIDLLLTFHILQPETSMNSKQRCIKLDSICHSSPAGRPPSHGYIVIDSHKRQGMTTSRHINVHLIFIGSKGPRHMYTRPFGAAPWQGHLLSNNKGTLNSLPSPATGDSLPASVPCTQTA